MMIFLYFAKNYCYFSDNVHNFVCKKTKPGHDPTPIPPPTEIPPGHCKDDESKKLVEFQGYCYKLNIVEESWEEAKLKCEILGEGYKIASFHSERESSFVYTMLSQLNSSAKETEFWIAANDRDEEKTWRNADETPFDYTNWADGEPNGSESV